MNLRMNLREAVRTDLNQFLVSFPLRAGVPQLVGRSPLAWNNFNEAMPPTKIIIYENDNNDGIRKKGYEKLKSMSVADGVDGEGVGTVRTNNSGDEYFTVWVDGDDVTQSGGGKKRRTKKRRTKRQRTKRRKSNKTSKRKSRKTRR